jgi:glyoxylase-like metal-dependent hydrolase (beta-lactamase superfamily II)
VDPSSGCIPIEIVQNLAGATRVIYPALIWDADGLMLVDAGFPGQGGLIRAAMERAGADFDRLNRVYLTHHDLDHIGSLRELVAARQGRLEVLTHELEKPYIEGTQAPHKLAHMEANLAALPPEGQAFYPIMKTAFENSHTRVDRTLEDGAELDLCGGVLVIHTPGHTLGHSCLYVRQENTLIAGDALAVDDGRLTLPGSALNYDTLQAQASLRKLSAYPIETVICYHGGMVRGNCTEIIAALLSQ